jgi:PIN domain nuclease of toxin-antitoxin system
MIQTTQSILLDTHTFLWWLFGDSKLSNKSRNTIKDMSMDVYISAASVWEIATKHRLGKLPRANSVAKNVPLWIERAGFISLPISAEHAQLAGTWKSNHRDPFDRMLAAQAKIEKMPILSSDKALKQFPVKVIS